MTDNSKNTYDFVDNDEQHASNFGFQKVSAKEKRERVNQVFSDVATKYDVMNDLMSAGIHRLWKDEFVHKIPNFNSSILDVAGGTGDISFRMHKLAKKYDKLPQITLCDLSPDMLKIAYNRAIDQNILTGIDYVCADAERLPFADNSFDYYTIAFGIRNVPNILNALREAFRVLKPSGKFLCLEFSKVQMNCLKPLYNFYTFNVIPKVGGVVAGSEEAYQYLAESISLFPDQLTFTNMIKEAGFSKVQHENLTFGVAAIHTAYKA